MDAEVLRHAQRDDSAFAITPPGSRWLLRRRWEDKADVTAAILWVTRGIARQPYDAGRSSGRAGELAVSLVHVLLAH